MHFLPGTVRFSLAIVAFCSHKPSRPNCFDKLVSNLSANTPSSCLCISENDSREWTKGSDPLQSSKTWPSPPATHFSEFTAGRGRVELRKQDSQSSRNSTASKPDPPMSEALTQNCQILMAGLPLRGSCLEIQYDRKHHVSLQVNVDKVDDQRWAAGGFAHGSRMHNKLHNCLGPHLFL